MSERDITRLHIVEESYCTLCEELCVTYEHQVKPKGEQWYRVRICELCAGRIAQSIFDHRVCRVEDTVYAMRDELTQLREALNL